MPLRKLNEQIRSSNIAPFYYFYGDEKYLADKALAMLKKSLVPKGLEDFALDKFTLTENTIDDVLLSAYMMPLMAQKRLIIVKDAEKMKDKDKGAFLKYIAAPSETSCIIFINNNGKIDKRQKFFSQFAKKGEIIEFKPLYENKLPFFIEAEAKNLLKTISDNAVNLLIQYVGNNLLELEAEIKKIAVAVSDKPRITSDDIKKYATDAKKNTIFELTDSIGSKDLVKSLKILKKMLERGEYPVLILSALTRHFNKLFEIKERLDKKEPKEEIAKKAKIHPFFLNKYISQAKKLAKRDIKKVFDSLLLTDIALKSRKLPNKIILEKLFFDLCI